MSSFLTLQFVNLHAEFSVTTKKLALLFSFEKCGQVTGMNIMNIKYLIWQRNEMLILQLLWVVLLQIIVVYYIKQFIIRKKNDFS